MSESTNSAMRILALLSSAKQKAVDRPTVVVWAEVFGLDPQSAENDPHEVQVRLKGMRDELDKLERQMRETRFSPELYVNYFDNIRRVVTVANLTASWGSFSNAVREDTLLALRFCAEIVPVEEGIPHEELQDILDKIHEFRNELATADLPVEARQFLRHQLEIMERGIQDYPIKGGDAVRTAFKTGFSEALATEIDLASDNTRTEISKVAKLWNMVRAAAKGITEIDRTATALSHVLEKGLPILDDAIKMLTSK